MSPPALRFDTRRYEFATDGATETRFRTLVDQNVAPDLAARRSGDEMPRVFVALVFVAQRDDQ